MGGPRRSVFAVAVAFGLVFAVALPSRAGATLEIVVAQAAQQGPPKTITFQENEVHGKTVATDAGGLLQLLFPDGTALTLGPESEVTVDSFVFDPAKSHATISATLKRGAFRFIGGSTSKTPGGVSLATPFGTVGVQSAGVELWLGAPKAPPHFDMLYGGSMTLSRGSASLASVHAAGYSIVPAAGGGSASVRKTRSEWNAEMQARLSYQRTGSAGGAIDFPPHGIVATVNFCLKFGRVAAYTWPFVLLF
jgi:FecR protein